MFTSVAVWRPIYVLRCGCGEANTIIIILLSDSLDMCTVGFAYLFIHYAVLVACSVQTLRRNVIEQRSHVNFCQSSSASTKKID